MDNKDNLKPMHPLLILLAFCYAVVFPEVLVLGFVDAEARNDWTGMLIMMVSAPIAGIFALFALGGGVWFLRESLRALATEPLATEQHMGSFAFSFGLLYPGVRIPYYWVKRIVFDGVPAFGNNPDNIYAVIGLNTLALGVFWAVIGAIAGGIFGVILSFMVRGFKRAK